MNCNVYTTLKTSKCLDIRTYVTVGKKHEYVIPPCQYFNKYHHENLIRVTLV